MSGGGLTPKEEKFCRLFVEQGGNDAARAYREAVSPKVSTKSSHEIASRYVKRPKIAARIEELREIIKEQIDDDFKVTVEGLTTKLTNLEERARKASDLRTELEVLTRLGKLHGHFVDKKDITIGMRPDEARDIVAGLLGKFAGKLGK